MLTTDVTTFKGFTDVLFSQINIQTFQGMFQVRYTNLAVINTWQDMSSFFNLYKDK